MKYVLISFLSLVCTPLAAQKSMTFDCSFTRMALTVKYLGEVRPVSAERQLLIEEASKVFPQLESVFALYENEIQVVSETSRPFWMPVQKQVLEKFKEEVKKGDQVRLFCQHLGSVEDSESVLLMIDYEKIQAPKIHKPI